MVFTRRAGAILLVVVSLWFSLSHLIGLIQKWDPQASETNEVVIWDSRLHSIKQALPAATEKVGYLAEWDMPGPKAVPPLVETPHWNLWDWAALYGLSDQLNEFQLTKYVLAPLVVERGSDDAWIIGNFSTRKFEGWLQATIGDYQAKDMGGGIYLIHKVQP